MDSVALVAIPAFLALIGTMAGLFIQHRQAQVNAQAKEVVGIAESKVQEIDAVLNSWKALSGRQDARITLLDVQVARLLEDHLECEKARIVLLRQVADLQSRP